MIFTGAISDIHLEIGMCPDVVEYSDEIDALEEEQADFEKLLARVEKAITKEQP